MDRTKFSTRFYISFCKILVFSTCCIKRIPLLVKLATAVNEKLLTEKLNYDNSLKL